jgi:glycine/D-amino acid oxidase-like deaminating enzyme
VTTARRAPATTGVPEVSLRSFWLSEALQADPGADCPPLSGTVNADVCIAGGGFAGLWTAYELTEREPSLSVALLEADVCGAGGSGANGGFFSSSWTDLVMLCDFFGESEGVRYATALGDEVAGLGEWVARHKADIEYHHEGILYARAGDWQTLPGEDVLALLEARGMGDRLRRVGAAEARAVADSPRFTGGVVTPDLATVQPAKLARELRRVLLERGVRIYEHTPLLDLQPGSPAWVSTPSGQVLAGQVVLTIGAWAVSQPRYRRAFAVATDYMVVTEPVPGLLDQIGWSTHRGIADRRDMLFYLRRTGDDRIAIGGGAMGVVFGDRLRGRAATSQRLAAVAAQGLTWLFPQFEGVRFTHAWSGPMDVTPPGVPFFHTWPGGNVHAGLGFSGHGLVPTRVGGRTLASLALHVDDEWSSLPVVGPPLGRVPPEPLRWPLVAAVEWAYRSGDQTQERGGSRGWARSAVGRAFDAYATHAGRRGRLR